MKKKIHFNKITSSVEIRREAKNTEINFNIAEYKNKILYFEFIETNEINIFYLIIKISNEQVFLEKKALIDFDGQIVYNKYLFNYERFKTLFEVNKYYNEVKITINNLLFNGDISDCELLINAYVFEENINQINLIDSVVVKTVNLLSIQDYYFNQN